MAIIEIEVIHDLVCAWCYIAKRTIDRAISLYQKAVPGGCSDIFSIKYQPHYLDYNPHARRVDKGELIDVRLRDMTPEQRKALFNRMNQIGRSMGIIFKAGGGREDWESFEAYHEREMGISDPDVLKGLAADAGVSGNEVNGWLDASPAAVDEEARRNKEESKSGVPVYIVQDEHRIDGSGDIAELLEIFNKVKETEMQGP